MNNNYDENKDYIEEKDAKPEQHRYPGMSGNNQTFKCPECSSYNTEQSTYYELCKTCGWFQGY